MQTKVAAVDEDNRPVTVDTFTLDNPRAGKVRLPVATASDRHLAPTMNHFTTAYEPSVALGHEATGMVKRVGNG